VARRALSPDEQWAADVRERVIAATHPFQRRAVECRRRFITLLVGRGGGKTTTMKARNIIKLTSIRRAKLLYTAPTRPMAEELLWEPLKQSIEQLGIMDDFEFAEAKLRCTCKRTGATLKLVGIDDQAEVEKQRGQPFDEVQPDEASIYKAKLLSQFLERVIGPRLGERNGTICMGGTPGHILSGPFYDYTRPGSPKHRTLEQLAERDIEEPPPGYTPNAEWDGWVSFAWTLKDVAELEHAAELYPALVNLWAEALRVKKREQWSDSNPIWLREYLGKWAADDTDMVFRYRAFLEDGRAWNQWDPFNGEKLAGILALKRAIAALPQEFKDWRFVDTLDMGHSDPFARNVFAFSPQDVLRRIFHVFFYEQPGFYARLIAEQTLGPELRTDKPGGIYEVTDWPDGAIMDGDNATIDELKNVYGLQFEQWERNPNTKVGAIELTNGDLIDGRIKVIKGSPLEQQLLELQWAEDIHGRLKENKAQANHSSDCLVIGRVKIAKLFEAGIVAQDAKPSPRGYKDPMGLAGDDDAGGGKRSEMASSHRFTDPWGNG
jgi:hypothetical protein